MEQVYPLFSFDPAGNGEREKIMEEVNFIKGDDLCARSEVDTLSVLQASSLDCVMAKAIPQMNQ